MGDGASARSGMKTCGADRRHTVSHAGHLGSRNILAQSIGSCKRDTMRRLSELLAREEVMEKQCSSVDWLKAGDRNTVFLQAKARQRARTNKIILSSARIGSACTDQCELEFLAAEFYKQLFSAQEHSQPKEVVRFVPE